MNEPVAWMQTFTQVKDGVELVKHAVNIEQVGINDIPLYTHPVKELNDGGEPVKNATYWKRQYNLMATQNDNLKSGLYHANEQIKYLESHPVKELTDEDIAKVVHELNQKANTPERWVTAMQIGAETIIQLRDELAILRKAQK